ncbi:MAG: hypothetical protein R3Y27_06235 [Clostridia bacterium]
MAKKLLSLSLVVIMLFAFAVPAFAAFSEAACKAAVAEYVGKGSYTLTAADITAGDFSYTVDGTIYYVTVDCDGYTFTCNAEYSAKSEDYTINGGVETEDESSNWFMSILIKIFSFFTSIFSNFSSLFSF